MIISGICNISINNNDIGDPQPLLLKPNGTDYNPFYLPEGTTDNIIFQSGDIINMSCPGGKVITNSIATNFTTIAAKCVKDKQFEVLGKPILFNLINCTDYPQHTARYTGNNCSGNYKETEIGFDLLDSNRFLRHIVTCFDDLTQNTIYSWFNLTAKIGGYQKYFPRPSNFLQSGFYNIHGVDRLYTRTDQRNTINKLIGLSENDTKYIHPTNAFFLSRGHLTAKTDFVYGTQQRLTFYFVNCAPQWQTFNGGNWRVLEQNVRDYASNKKIDLIVYTGTYGIATLPHAVTGVDTKLFLYVDENGNTALPVPQVYWKYVYDPINDAGAVFVGVNNPYENKSTPICNDVSDSMKWLSWKKDDQTAGFSYACKVEDFIKVVNYLPVSQNVRYLLI